MCHGDISIRVPSEISKSEKGGRRGVLLPGKERCRARTVSAAEDGSLWVSKKVWVRVSEVTVWELKEHFYVRSMVHLFAISITTGWIPVTVKKKYMELYDTMLKLSMWCYRWRRHPWDLPQVLRRSLTFPLFYWDHLSFPEARMLS